MSQNETLTRFEPLAENATGEFPPQAQLLDFRIGRMIPISVGFISLRGEPGRRAIILKIDSLGRRCTHRIDNSYKTIDFFNEIDNINLTNGYGRLMFGVPYTATVCE